MKDLIIFPGASDPRHLDDKEGSYKFTDFYQKLYNTALKYDFNVDIPSYIGHASHPDSKPMSVAGIIKIMKKRIDSFENKKKPYYILALSFGTFGLIEILKDTKLDYLNKVVLWGSGTCEKYYNILLGKEKEKNIRRLRENGTIIDENIYDSIYPFLVSIFQIMNQNLSYEVVICGGANDEYYTESLRENLMKVSRNNEQIKIPQRVPNVDHLPSLENEICRDLLFGECE